MTREFPTSKIPPEQTGESEEEAVVEGMRETGEIVSLKTPKDIERYYSAKKAEELKKPLEEQDRKLLEHFDFYIQHPEKRLQIEATPEQLKDLMPNEEEIRLALQEQDLEDTSENRSKLQTELFSSREYLNWKKMVVDLCKDSLSLIHSSTENEIGKRGSERRYFPTDDQLLATTVERLFYKEIWSLRTLSVTEASQRLKDINYGFSVIKEDRFPNWNDFKRTGGLVESYSRRIKEERERISSRRDDKQYEELAAFDSRKQQEGRELGVSVAFMGRGEVLGLLLNSNGNVHDVERFVNSSAYFRKIEKDGLKYRKDYGGDFIFSSRPADEKSERKQEREEIIAMLPELNYLMGGLETIKKEMQPWEEDVKYGRKPSSSDPEALKKFLVDKNFHQDFEGYYYDAEAEIDDKTRKVLRKNLDQGRKDIERESATKKEMRVVEEKRKKIKEIEEKIENLTRLIKIFQETIDECTEKTEQNNKKIAEKRETKIQEEHNKGLMGKPKNPQLIATLDSEIKKLDKENQELMKTIEGQKERSRKAEADQQQATKDLEALTEQK